MPASGNEDNVVCPVDGCRYTDAVESVAAHVSGKKDSKHDWQALGYDTYYQYIREQRTAPSSSQSVLVHMTDSHIGREKGGHHGKGWEIDCATGFRKAVDAAISVDADAVVHTGDLFHNDSTTGITNKHLGICIRELAKLLESDISFFYILGDHEREDGKRARDKLVDLELAQPLDTAPILVDDHFALYGLDHRPISWWTSGHFDPEPPPRERTAVLALHQSLYQFVNPDQAECDAREVLRRARLRNFAFDAIIDGQHHKDARDVVQGCKVLCGGATERISKRSFEPFVRVFTADADGLSHRKISLDV
ncbi:metallophosphoesterase family protein [Haloplanus rubicundus]|uniref:Calcineurin-like phosphoesterase domain-containing protein n=1 Tax=Haloplanus rubicundus TaxID=1547898 RepID=A0A345E8B8_9EURY|nr:metallophosphoesterase [Haloplanus rubicundus]AXG08440.1 hypothetical protein DU484_00455 [Haloplanus rubicundus]